MSDALEGMAVPPADGLAAPPDAAASDERLRVPGVVLGVASALILGAHMLLGAEPMPLLARFIAGLMGVFTMFVLLRVSRRTIPFIAYGVVQIYVFFGLATFWSTEFMTLAGPVFLRDEAIIAAVASAFASMIALVGMGQVGARVGARVRQRIPDVLAVDALRAGSSEIVGGAALAVLTLLLGLQFSVQAGIPAALSQVVFALARPPLAQALIFAIYRAKRSRLAYGMFIGYTAAALFLGLLSGMLADLMTPLLTAVVLLWLDGRKLRLRWVVAIVLVFFVLNPVKHAFRKEKLERTMVGETVKISEVASLWADAVRETWVADSRDDNVAEENLETSTSRLSALLSVANVIQSVPDEVPHSGGARWSLILGSYIPRALAPDRPDLTLATSGDYALTFLLQTESQLEHTTIALPLVSDGFWAFGWWGVLFAILAVGFLFGLHEGLFLPNSWVALVMGVSTWPYLTSYDHLVHQFTGIPQRLFVSWFVCACVAFALRAFDRKRSTPRSPTQQRPALRVVN